MNIKGNINHDANCPVCGNSGAVFIGNPKISHSVKYFLRKDYSVVQCINCSYYFVSPSIDFSSEEWKQLYNSTYFSVMTDWHKRNRLADIQNRFKKLTEYGSYSAGTFLDIGCGEGLCLVEACKLGWNCYGIDISDNRVDEAKKPGINFTPGDIFSAAYPDDFFDCIYMDSVLEHLTNPIVYLKEIKRVLKCNGILYIGVPNEDALFNSVKKFIYSLTGYKTSAKIKPFVPPYHVGGFNKKSLSIAAMESGFNITSLRSFAAHYEFLKYPFCSKNYFLHLFMLPVDLLAIVLEKEIYLEAYLKRNKSG